MQRKLVRATLILILLSLPLLTWLCQQQELRRVLELRSAFANTLYEQLSTERLSLLHGLLDQISLREDVRLALRAGDRQELLRIMQPVLEHLHKENGVSLLHFHDQSGKMLLRVQQPAVFGDKVNRYLLTSAQQGTDVVAGLEMGNLGHLSLRSITPVRVADELLGFIEIGQHIEGLVQQLNSLNDTRLLLLVDKAFVGREAWEKGLQAASREHSWDLLSDRVIAHPTKDQFPPELMTVILREAQKGKGNKEFRIAFAEEHYAGRVFPLHDVVQSVVGDRLVVCDITTEIHRNRPILLASVGFSVTLGCLFGLLLRKE